MSRVRPALRTYIALVTLTALVAVAASASSARGLSDKDLLLFGIYVVFACAARLWVVHLSTKIKFTGEDLVTFAAALTLGPFPAIVIAGSSELVMRRGGRRVSWYNRLFNVSAGILRAGAAAWTYQALAQGRVLSDAPFAALAACIVHYLVGTIVVDVAVSLQLRRSITRTWWLVHRRDISQTAALYLLGALAALLASRDPLAVFLFFLPMLLLIRSLRATTRLRDATKEAVFELADLIDKRDAYTHGHSQRVAGYAEQLARHLRLPESQVELIALAARVHDIGKIATPDDVLRKPGPLTAEEFERMREHAHDGEIFLSKVPAFWEGAALVGAHHERVDGAGYPRSFKGTEISIEATVIAVADAFDAMTTDRPYRQALRWPEVQIELQRGRDTQWDARIVDAFIEMIGAMDAERALPIRAATA